MVREHGDRVEFILVYIREAHPADGWQVRANRKDGIIYNQPATYAERRQVAQACEVGMGLEMPTVVDGMNDTVDRSYAAFPTRIYLVGEDGRVVFKGDRGPKGYRPGDLDRAIKGLLAG